MRKYIVLCLCWMAGFLPCLSQTSTDKLFPNAVISRSHYDKMKADLQSKPDETFPGKWYYTKIKSRADEIIKENKVPATAVSTKNNPSNVDISSEMNDIYLLCLTYAFEQKEIYLDKAVEYLSAWAKVNVPVTKDNLHEEGYNKGVEGYSLIRRVITDEQRSLIDGWVRKRGELFAKENDVRVNNWTTCLMYQFYLFGKVLEDDNILNKYNTQYDTWVIKNLFPNGTTTDLLGRDAFAYHAYDLMFFAHLGHAIGTYEGYDKADEFYKKDVNLGASIQHSVDFWKPFLLYPDKYTHTEFVDTEYAPDKNRTDYNKTYNPSGTLYVIDELYEFDSSLEEILKKYNRTYNNGKVALGMSYLRWFYK